LFAPWPPPCLLNPRGSCVPLSRAPSSVPAEGLRLPRVSAEAVALIPQCAKRREVWLPADEERWQARLTDDKPAELVFYCPECAEREFGPH
jgi:hypothetical protein